MKAMRNTAPPSPWELEAPLPGLSLGYAVGVDLGLGAQSLRALCVPSQESATLRALLRRLQLAGAGVFLPLLETVSQPDALWLLFPQVSPLLPASSLRPMLERSGTYRRLPSQAPPSLGADAAPMDEAQLLLTRALDCLAAQKLSALSAGLTQPESLVRMGGSPFVDTLWLCDALLSAKQAAQPAGLWRPLVRFMEGQGGTAASLASELLRGMRAPERVLPEAISEDASEDGAAPQTASTSEVDEAASEDDAAPLETPLKPQAEHVVEAPSAPSEPPPRFLPAQAFEAMEPTRTQPAALLVSQIGASAPRKTAAFTHKLRSQDRLERWLTTSTSRWALLALPCLLLSVFALQPVQARVAGAVSSPEGLEAVTGPGSYFQRQSAAPRLSAALVKELAEPRDPADASAAMAERSLVRVECRSGYNAWVNGLSKGACPVALRLPPGWHAIAIGQRAPWKRRVIQLRPGTRFKRVTFGASGPQPSSRVSRPRRILPSRSL